MAGFFGGISQSLVHGPGWLEAFSGNYRRGRPVTWNSLLASSSVGSSVLGLIAQASELPPQVTWSFVFLSLIPCVTLSIRAIYSYAVRRLESRERMEMIARGLMPPSVVGTPIANPEGPATDEPKGKS